jgi:serine/threonine protein kinase
MPASIERCINCFRETIEVPCQYCGWMPGHPTKPPYIPVGTVLNDCYRIGRVLGHGGFGITYLAWDTHLDLPIAIKEYFPRILATRVGDTLSLSVYPGEKRTWFEDSLHSFQEEARILARFQRHPAIVGVYSFFRANNTCYMVMEYIAGITLKSYLRHHKEVLSYRSSYKVMSPIMDALQSVHAVGLLHRDVSPHNIYITQQKQVKLLDFGAARFFAEEHNEDLSVILKPGYAPPEQYQAQGNQGPWTDVYGLAATFYHCLTGGPPPDAIERTQVETLVMPSSQDVEIPPTAEYALLKGLALDIADRFQDIESFRQALPRPEHVEAQSELFQPSPGFSNQNFNLRPPSTTVKLKTNFISTWVIRIILIIAVPAILILTFFS